MTIQEIRVIPIIIDLVRGIIIESNGAPSQAKFRMVRGDDIQFDIDCVHANVATETLTPVGFSEQTIFRVVAKKEKDYSGQEMIVAEPTAFNVVGHRADMSVAGGKLSVRLKLNRKALLDALGTSAAFQKIVIDVEAIHLNGGVSTLLQFSDDVLNDAARNPTQVDGSAVEYMTLEDLRAEIRKVTHPDGGKYRLENGDLKLFDIALMDYQAVALDDHALTPLEDA